MNNCGIIFGRENHQTATLNLIPWGIKICDPLMQIKREQKMKPKEELYFAIYENGNHVEKDDLNSLAALTGYKYLIKRCLYHVYETSNPNYNRHFYHYFSINEHGKEKPVSVGDFECLDIGKEEGHYDYNGTICKILDKKRNTVHDLKIDKRGIEYFHNNLIPILEELNRLGSWDSYMVVMENVRLRRDIENLSDQVNKLTNEIAELKKSSPC